MRGSSVPTKSTKRSGRSWCRRTRSTSTAAAGAASTPSGITRSRAASMPATSRSRRLASLEVSTSVAAPLITSRLRRITRTPWRVNLVGSRRKARSWTVTTRGAAVGHGTRPVAWATSTGTGRPLDRGAPGAQPGLVEQRTGQRELGDRNRRAPRRGRRAAVPGGDAEQRDLTPRHEPPGHLEGGDGGAAGRVVPQLLEGVRHAHAANDGGCGLTMSRMPGSDGFWTDRRVVVTGGSGFLGRQVVAQLGPAAPTSSPRAGPSTT